MHFAQTDLHFTHNAIPILNSIYCVCQLHEQFMIDMQADLDRVF